MNDKKYKLKLKKQVICDGGRSSYECFGTTYGGDSGLDSDR